MYKNSLGVFLRSAGMALVLGVVSAMASSCGGNKENNEPEPVKESVEFTQTTVSIPIDGNGSVSLKVTPMEKLADVEVNVADEGVIDLDKASDSEGYVFTMKAKSLGSTTIVAVLGSSIAKCAVSVDPIAVTGISLDKTSIQLVVGATETLSAKVTPDNATSPSISWDSSDKEVATVDNGVVTAVSAGKATITAASSSFTAECVVEVKTIEAESLTLDVASKLLTVDESFIVNATILPEGTTYKNVEWIVDDPKVIKIEPFDAVESDNLVSAKVIALNAGNAKLTAVIKDIKATCSFSVKSKEIPATDPKIGDYYYSDGTWSDGGLLSINSDGTKAVWAADKPAPVEGKTVIGIVFQTDKSRFSELEQKQGFTHGLVFCTKGAHAPGAQLTKYAMNEGIDCISNHKRGDVWYKDIYGQLWTATVRNTYPGEQLAQYPAFDWTTTDFVPSAPAKTSGWFVPSIGQLWDCMANLGGEEVAQYLSGLRDYGYDVTYFGNVKLSYKPMDAINAHFAKIPAAQKEELVYSMTRSGQGVCQIMSSTIYDNTDGLCCIFWLGENLEFEPYCEWMNQDFVCHPVLAF